MEWQGSPVGHQNQAAGSRRLTLQELALVVDHEVIVRESNCGHQVQQSAHPL